MIELNKGNQINHLLQPELSPQLNTAELFSVLITYSPVAIAILDRQMCYLAASEKWLQDYQLKLQNLVGRSHYDIFPEVSEYWQAIYQRCLAGATEKRNEDLIEHPDGRIDWLKWEVSPWYENSGEVGGIIIVTELITQARQLETFFNLALDLLCIIGIDGNFKQINPAVTKVLGYAQTELIGQSFLNLVHPQDQVKTLEELAKLATGKTINSWTNRYRCQDGCYKYLEWQIASNTQLGLIYAIARDGSQSQQLIEQIAWQASHDSLTKLYNRQEFEQKVIEAIAKQTAFGHTNSEQPVFCYLDLDRFRLLNDLCGHRVGDEILRQIADILKQQVHPQDPIARIGGDEFGILFSQCSLQQAEIIANQIREQIQAIRFKWQNKTFTIGVSIGVVAIERNSCDFGNLLCLADTACHAAKQMGRNCVKVYRADDEKLNRQREERQWISRLISALEEDRFVLYSQKISSLKEKNLNHYEILLRLLDEEGNLVSPMSFIPAAESYDLMPEIDRWVIKNFFANYSDHCQNQVTGQKSTTMYTINLSGASLNSDRFFDFLKEQLATYPISPQNICFEITETVAISNLDIVAQFIRELKELGCLFALDDFGSGMSSLAYLKTLPVDYLKIDGSFVKNIVNDPVDCATVECFSKISTVMNIQTIAEFVENEQIIAKLQELGIDYAQGYGIGKPLPLCFINN
jgi:diguanylate cyclase (GGDEF)-like protein/PAS domain S-box-containing protein